MKKTLGLLTVALMACGLVACQPSDPYSVLDSTSQDPVQDSTSTSADSSSSSSSTSSDTPVSSTTVPDSSSSDPASSSSTPEVVTYRVRLTVPTGVEAHASVDEAAPGETVTVVIDNVEAGYSISSVVLNGTTALTSSDGINYVFTMPDRSASVVITATVSGDITLVGDVVAALTLNAETGIYEARNVKVATSSTMAVFAYQVKEGDDYTMLDSSSVDETKCFANITFHYEASGVRTYTLEIASGCTYDFFYDPSASRPCYVKRVSVDVLPTNESSLYTLFDGAIRSEITVNPDDLTSFTYNITEPTASPAKAINTTMKKYADNTTLLTATDNLQGQSYFQYKHYDSSNNVIEVADNYTRTNGNDDPTRPSSRASTGFSARYDVVTDLESGRFEMSEPEAYNALNKTAHQMGTLEDDFMRAYRVGYTADEVSSYDVNISSEAITGGFKTTIDSYIEYDSSAGTYTEEMHEAHVFSVVLEFTTDGKVTKLDYRETVYSEQNWSFANHEPLSGAVGTTVKVIDADYNYGEEITDTLSSTTFDPSAYFISSFDDVHFYNSKTGEDPAGNYLYYNDKVMVASTDAGVDPTNCTVSYLPSTAMDLWQYAPTESSDDNVITQTDYDTYNQMTCVGIGTATVTLTNHTVSSGISHDVEITVAFNSTDTFHGFALNANTNSNVTSTTSANIYAGTTESYDVIITPASFPPIYNAVSFNPDLLKVVSAGSKLVLDASAAADITQVTDVLVRISSQYYFQPGTYIDLTISIIPNSNTVVGMWKADDTENYPSTTVEFTQTEYTGEYPTSVFSTTPYVGTIVDVYSAQTWQFHFIYTYSNGNLVTYYLGQTTTGEEYPNVDLEMEYNPGTDVLAVALTYLEMSEDAWEATMWGIIGAVSDEGYVDYATFSRAE